MSTFQHMDLPTPLAQALQHMQFKQPTPIQAKTIPLALAGKDILGSAQTGTGKTGAFGIPLITHLLTNPDACALVMTPTRELATQVMNQLQLMLGKTKVNAALLIGGEAMPKQLKLLRRRPRLIVGTPGRINDHLQRNTLKLDQSNFLVLDETDRMLDMGFTVQIETILKRMPKQRQTLLFSATLPSNISRIAKQYLKNPERIAINETLKVAKNIQQDIRHIKEADKYTTLLAELDEREGSIIVFVKTKAGTEKMAQRLAKKGYQADAIHGNLRQHKRERVLRGFRKKRYRILVATDVAARGLDIPHIEHVINYDLPHCAEDYIHRIGRTARAGAAGFALSLISPADKRKWRAIDILLNPEKKDAKPRKRNDKRNENNKKRKYGGKRKAKADVVPLHKKHKKAKRKIAG